MLRYRSHEDVKLIIDDSDTSVTYSGNWGTNSSYAAYLQAYGSTMHYTVQPNATASISFYDSYITVFGILPSNYALENVGVSAAPSLSSYHIDDGAPVLLSTSFTTTSFTNQAFFQPSAALSDGYHTLVITNLDGLLALDYFAIVPANSGSSPYIQKIDDASPNITYNNAKPLSNTGQADFNTTLHSLSSPLSTASLSFNGNFVAVYGALPVGNSLPNISFTLDNNVQPVPTNASDKTGSTPPLPATGPGTQRLSQVLFWKSSILNDGQHNLSITVEDGEFFLDFILLQKLDDTGIGSTPSLWPSLYSTDFAPTQSASAPLYGSVTPSGHAGTSSDHTEITSVIVGGVVGRAVSFVVLLLALYMIRILSKRRSGLRFTTTESSSRPPVQAIPTIATAGTPYGSGQRVTVRSSMESVPPPYQPMDEIHEEEVIPAEMNEAERGVMQEP